MNRASVYISIGPGFDPQHCLLLFSVLHIQKIEAGSGDCSTKILEQGLNLKFLETCSSPDQTESNLAPHMAALASCHRFHQNNDT